MPEVNYCQFCGALSTLLCDGAIWESYHGKRFRVPFNSRVPAGKRIGTCDAKVCRSCAKKVMDLHMKTTKGCRWDTRDLCPLCQAAQDKPVEM